jgi:hypothetical protein
MRLHGLLTAARKATAKSARHLFTAAAVGPATGNSASPTRHHNEPDNESQKAMIDCVSSNKGPDEKVSSESSAAFRPKRTMARQQGGCWCSAIGLTTLVQ